MADYSVNYTLDVKDLYDEMTDWQKMDFLDEAIRDLDYGKDYDVVEKAATSLDESQMKDLINALFDNISSDNERQHIVSCLIDSLPMAQRDALLASMAE